MFYLYAKPEKWWLGQIGEFTFENFKIVRSRLYTNIFEYLLTFMCEVYVLWDVSVSAM